MKEERKEKKGRGRSIAIAALVLCILALLLFLLRPSPARVGPPSAAPDLELAQRERGWAKRTAGIEALAAGDLDRAIAELTEAGGLLRDPSEVAELLRAAQDWKARAAAKDSEARASRVEASSPPGGAKPPTAAAQPPPTAAPGVDGTQAPSEKANPEPSASDEGSAKAGAASTAAPENSAPSRGDWAEANEVAPSLAPGPDRPPGPSAGVVGPAPEPEPEPEEVDPGKGGLNVTSPGLYAEVWINGRSYGFPPIAARNLPAGVADIVVRVNGDIVRTAKAVVVRDHVTALQMR
jgi:hypothetical protein